MKTLKEELKQSCGLTEKDFDSHETDLYIRKTEKVYNYLKNKYQFFGNITSFISWMDGTTWLDVPFAAWNEKFYAKEWNDKDFEKVNEAIKQEFGGKVFINHKNENVLFPDDMERIEMILGLPYTSSGIHPQISLDCNVHILFPANTQFHYDFVTMNEDKNIVFVLSDRQENRKYIYV